MANYAICTLVTGNTYPHREKLRAMGGTWDPSQKGWQIPNPRAAEALALCRTTSTTPGGKVRRAWAPCGYPGCHPSYCDECDGAGYRHGR